MDTHALKQLTLSRLLQDEVHPVTMAKINKQNVQNLVESFSKLNHNEKLLFLVSLNCPQQQQQPQEPQEKQQKHPVKSPITMTTEWLLKNFTPDPQTALPKEEVYDFYAKSTATTESKPISTADFGKLMRQVFPSVKARRLGQRGASKYCYANIRKKSEYDLETPKLSEVQCPSPINELLAWGASNFSLNFSDLSQLLSYLKCNNFKSARKRRNSSFCKKKEDLEIRKYFPDNDNWPQLRGLLSNANNNKKRHCSSNVALASSVAMEIQNRSASVPIFDVSNVTNEVSNAQRTGACRSADSGYDSVHSNTPVIDNMNNFNPLLSSVVNDDDVLFDSVFDLIVDEREDFFE